MLRDLHPKGTPVIELILQEIEKRLSGTRAALVKIVPGYPDYMIGQQFVLPPESIRYPDAYKLIPSVYACISLIQGAISSLPLKFYKGPADKQNLIKRSPGNIAELWSTANGQDTGYDMIEQLIGSLEIFGNAYLFVDYMRTDSPKEFWPLPGNRVNPVPGPNRTIAAYDYDIGDGSIIRIPQQQIVHFRHYNPDNSIVGLSPLSVAAMAFATERDAARWLRQFYSKGAIVAGHYSAEQTLSDPDIERIKLELKRRNMGPENAWQPVILPRGLKFERQGLTHQEMQFLQTAELTTADIMRIFRIPPVLLGVKAGGGLSDAGASADLVLFWQNCIMPRTSKMEAVLNEKLLSGGNFGPSVTCKFDFSNVLALQEVFLSQAEAYQRATGGPILTRAEARERLGLVKLNEPELDKLIMPKAATSPDEVNKNPQWTAKPGPVGGQPAGGAPNKLPIKAPPPNGKPKIPVKAAASFLGRPLAGREGNRLSATEGPESVRGRTPAGNGASRMSSSGLPKEWFNGSAEE